MKKALTSKTAIIPTAVYTREEVIELTGMSKATIQRAEKSQKLRRSEGDGFPRYLGINILLWLGLAPDSIIHITIDGAPLSKPGTESDPKTDAKPGCPMECALSKLLTKLREIEL